MKQHLLFGVPRYKDINTQSAVIVFFPVLVAEIQIGSLSIQGKEQNFSVVWNDLRAETFLFPGGSGKWGFLTCDRLLSAEWGAVAFTRCSCFSVMTVTSTCYSDTSDEVSWKERRCWPSPLETPSMWMNTGQEKAKGKIEDKYFLFLTVTLLKTTTRYHIREAPW